MLELPTQSQPFGSLNSDILGYKEQPITRATNLDNMVKLTLGEVYGKEPFENMLHASILLAL